MEVRCTLLGGGGVEGVAILLQSTLALLHLPITDTSLCQAGDELPAKKNYLITSAIRFFLLWTPNCVCRDHRELTALDAAVQDLSAHTNESPDS